VGGGGGEGGHQISPGNPGAGRLTILFSSYPFTYLQAGTDMYQAAAGRWTVQAGHDMYETASGR
jgi:hypothetical protein